MTEEDALKSLRRCEVFSNLDEDELEQVASMGHARSYTSKHIVYKRGTESEALYVLLQGSVRLLYELENDPAFHLASMVPSDAFGESSLLRSEPHLAFAVSFAQDTEIFLLMKEDLHRLLMPDSPLALRISLGFCQLLAKRLRQAANPPNSAIHHMGEKFKSYHDSMGKVNQYFASNMFCKK